MFKNLVFISLLILITGCSNKNPDVATLKDDKKEEVVLDENISNETNKIDSPDITLVKEIEVKTIKDVVEMFTYEPKSFSFVFQGSWKAKNSSAFLEKKLILNKRNFNKITGNLEFSFLNSNATLIEKQNFGVEIYIKSENEIVMFIKDVNTNEKEELTLIRDSKDEFRLISKLQNSRYFEGDETSFLRVKPKQNKKQIVKKKKVEEKFVSGNDIVIDANRKLVWQDTLSTSFIKASYDDANKYCNTLKLDNSKKWRLPTRSELKTIYSKTSSNLHLVFNNGVKDCYWTSNKSLDAKSMVWCFDFKKGSEKLINEEIKTNIRCVKDK